MAETNYWSGEDYVVEFLGYRFGFNHGDFEQRVTAAGPLFVSERASSAERMT